MRHRILAAVLALTSACATTARPTTPAQPPVAAARAPKAEPTFIVLGEAIAFDGSEPVTRLHADGTSEVFNNQTWTPAQKIEPDGDVLHEGKWIGSLTREHLRGIRIEVSGAEIRGWTPDGDLRLVLAPDGSYSATLAHRATPNRYRIQGTNPEARRTLFMLLSVIAIVNYRRDASAKQSA